MAATKVVAGILREVWSNTAQNGGVAEVITTNIKCGLGQLPRIHGLLVVNAAVGTPVLGATTAVVNGKLVVTVTNSAAPGNTATWLLDVTFVQSIQQANSTGQSYILVANAGAGGGTPVTETLALAYTTGTNVVDQTLVLTDAKGPLVLDGTTSFTTNVVCQMTGLNSSFLEFTQYGGVTAYAVRTLATGTPGVNWAPITVFGNLTLNGAGTTPTTTCAYFGHSTVNGSGGTPVVTNAYNVLIGTAPTGTSITFTNSWSLGVLGNANFAAKVGIALAGTPTARLHLAGVTTVAGTAPLKIDSGTVLSVTENGAVESDGTSLYWTDNTGTRRQLNNNAGSGATLATTYAAGLNTTDQTLVLTNPKGPFAIDSFTSFTSVVAFSVNGLNSSYLAIDQYGGMTAYSVKTLVSGAPGMNWAAVYTQGALTLSGATLTSSVAHVYFGPVGISGSGGSPTVTNAYSVFIAAAPTGSSITFTNSWSLGVLGDAKFATNIAVGSATVLGGAAGTVVFAAGTAPSPSSAYAARTYLMAQLFQGIGGSGKCAWAVYQEEADIGISGQVADRLIPITYNGKSMYLFARDVTPS